MNVIKEVAYLVHIPFIIIGFICGTIWFGLSNSFNRTIEFWDEG